MNLLHSKISNRLLIAGMLSFLIMMSIRNMYGVNLADEMFYFSSTYRFVQGDAMLVDDWHPTQLTSFILYPLIYTFISTTGGTEGIIYTFRVIYILFQLIVAYFSWHALKSLGKFRIWPAIIYLLSTPYNINTLSYNTLSIGFIYLICSLLTKKEHTSLEIVLIGVLYALSVVANPYLVILIILFVLMLVLNMFNSTGEQIFNLRFFKHIVIGILLIFIPFIIFIFSRASLDEILINLPHVFSDPEHNQTLIQKIYEYPRSLFKTNPALTTINALIVIALIIFKTRISTNKILILSFIKLALGVIYYSVSIQKIPINLMLIPMFWFGLEMFFISNQIDYVNMIRFRIWLIIGFVFSFCVNMASNTGILSISASFVVLGSGAVVTGMEIYKFISKDDQRSFKYDRLHRKCDLTLVMITIALISVTAIQFYQRINFIWDEPKLTACTTRINSGPAKGLYTTDEKRDAYENELRMIDLLEVKKDDKILFNGDSSYKYLYSQSKFATFQTFRLSDSSFYLRHDEYFNLHPEKLPTIVVISEFEESDMNRNLIKKLIDLGYNIFQLENNLILRNNS